MRLDSRPPDVLRPLTFQRHFTGQAPDLRMAIAAQLTRTVSTDDPQYKGMMGYYTGFETEYRFSQLFSLTFQAYGESRGSYLGEFSVYSLNPGISFHSDWPEVRCDVASARQISFEQADERRNARLRQWTIADVLTGECGLVHVGAHVARIDPIHSE